MNHMSIKSLLASIIVQKTILFQSRQVYVCTNKKKSAAAVIVSELYFIAF